MIRNCICLFLFSLVPFAYQAQEQQADVIKVKKNFVLLKVSYDYDNYLLNAVDKYGNLHEDAVQSFDVKFLSKENETVYPSNGNRCSELIIRKIRNLNKGERFVFTNIKAKDQGVIVSLPDHEEISKAPSKK